jgi:hypothetical protein
MACLICSTDVLKALPMHEKDLLVRVVREILDGMVTTAQSSALKDIKPTPRRGVCIVARCALYVESSCGGCREEGCARCMIAAELRSAEDRINAARDAELAALGVAEEDLDPLVDQLVENLCKEHVQFGSTLVDEWYVRRRSLATSATSAPIS